MKILKYTLVALTTIVLISCGEKKEKKEEGFKYETKKADEAKEETVSSEKAVSNDVMLTSNDQMQFNMKEIKVKAGEKVTLTLKHTGKMAKNIMGHNFVLLTQGTDLVDFASKAAAARDTDYIPEGTTEVIAHTKIIGGGETDVIEFDAPAPGSYEFLCSFPGHYGMMKGVFIVE